MLVVVKEMKVIRTLMPINHLVYSLPLLHKTDELNSLRKRPTFCDATTGFRATTTDEVSLLIWVVLLIGRVAKGIYFNQSEALHRYG